MMAARGDESSAVPMPAATAAAAMVLATVVAMAAAAAVPLVAAEVVAEVVGTAEGSLSSSRMGSMICRGLGVGERSGMWRVMPPSHVGGVRGRESTEVSGEEGLSQLWREGD